MLKTLQFLIGGAVGWGFVFASIMQISENPWYHTVLGIVVGLVIFGWGLRPILGKSAIKYVFIGTLGSAGSIAFIGFLGSDTVLSPYLGFLSLLAIIYISFRIIRWIVREIVSRVRTFKRRREDRRKLWDLYKKVQEQNQNNQDEEELFY